MKISFLFASLLVACVTADDRYNQQQQQHHHHPTTTSAPYPSNNCTDAFGNTLRAVIGHPDRYELVVRTGTGGDHDNLGNNNGNNNGNNLQIVTLRCCAGTQFTLSACACSIIPPTVPRQFQCQLWLPFETDFNDKSINQFQSYAFGKVELDSKKPLSGDRSLRLKHGGLEIPDMSSVRLNNPLGVTFCFSFRCNEPSCCSNGGILSDNRDLSTSFFSIISAIVDSKLVVRLMTTDARVSLEATPSVGWNVVCVVFSSNTTVQLFLNGHLVATAALTGELVFSHNPYVVGNDRFYGFFGGNIDNVLVCNSPLSIHQIRAYDDGNFQVLAAAGLIPESSVPPRRHKHRNRSGEKKRKHGKRQHLLF